MDAAAVDQIRLNFNAQGLFVIVIGMFRWAKSPGGWADCCHLYTNGLWLNSWNPNWMG